MWPETMPVPNLVKKILYIPLLFWKNLRDKYLFNSDTVIAECELFDKQLVYNTGLKNIVTLYFCKKANFINYLELDNFDNQINLCYLGSINNIIDYNIIALLVKVLSKEKKVVVHIIGDGEKRKEMTFAIKKAGGSVVFHGKVFDNDEKKELLKKCHYALNIMKKNVNVGMTMKSLDYFSFGIPIINNIAGDIGEIVENEHIGFNVNYLNYTQIARQILDLEWKTYIKIRENVCAVHAKYFSIEMFEEQLEKII